MRDWSFETRQGAAGASLDPTTGACAVAIHQTTGYTFRMGIDSIQDILADLNAGFLGAKGA